jgi:N-acyl-phosphatidylethanolamine-hydrolysing phospholipase D
MKQHHRPGGFQNNHIEFKPKGLVDVLKWKFGAGAAIPSKPTPAMTADHAFVLANAQPHAMKPAITWVGHATMLAQLGGLNLITDPVFSQRCSPFSFAGPKRHAAPGLSMAQLPHIDAVLISHNHYDHLDEASVLTLHAQPGGAPVFIVPLGIKAWMAKRGIHRVVELDWWETHSMDAISGPVDVVFTPAQHWSGRGLHDRMKTLWGGFAVLSPDCHLFFAGDTAYSRDFLDIQAHFAARQAPELGGGFDIALIPVGAYEPRWFMKNQHTNPAESVQIHIDLQAKRSVGIHWGTFVLTDEPLHQPVQDLVAASCAQGLEPEEFTVMAVGESLRLAPRWASVAASRA